jgi:hypothetical protein
MITKHGPSTVRKLVLASVLAVVLSFYFVPLAIQSNAAGGLNSSSVSLYGPLGPAFYDSYYGQTLVEVVQGTALNITVDFTPSVACPTVGCNMSIGIAFDSTPNYTTTATYYTNASNANPHSTFTALPSKPYVVTFSVTTPTGVSNLVAHQYQVDIVNFAKQNNASSSETLLRTLSGSIAFILSTQDSYWTSEQMLASLTTAYSTTFNDVLSSSIAYQYSSMQNSLTQSSIASTKASQYYQEGNFASASSYETTALNNFNQAISSYQSSANSLAGVSNSASFISYGYLLVGIGALIAGIGYVVRSVRKGP